MAHLVGKRVEVYWELDEKFYRGRVARYAPRTGKHEVAYDDDESEWLRLDRARHRFVDGSGARYAIEWEWADEAARSEHAAAVEQLVAVVGATPQVAAAYLDEHGSLAAAVERYLRDRDGGDRPRRGAKPSGTERGQAATPPRRRRRDDAPAATAAKRRRPDKGWPKREAEVGGDLKIRRSAAASTAGDEALARRLAAALPPRRGRSAAQTEAPSEDGWCVCGGPGTGAMVRCDDPNCNLGHGWFHFACVGLTGPPPGRWRCPECRPAPPPKRRQRERYCWCNRVDDGQPMVECSAGHCARPWHHFACVGLAADVPDNWACAACERADAAVAAAAILDVGTTLVARTCEEVVRRAAGAALADVVYTVHRGALGRRRWRDPARDTAHIADRAQCRECLTALLWAAALRGAPCGPAFDAEVAAFARVARLGPPRPKPAPLIAVVRSLKGLVLFRAPLDYAAAFGFTDHARAHHASVLEAAACAPGRRGSTSSRRALQVRPAFPSQAAPPPADRTAHFLRMLRARECIRVAKAAGKPWPWSDDDVLNRHKFTNVKRKHDRVTTWLRDHWTAAHPTADAATVLFNCGVFRVFGTVAFAQRLGWTCDVQAWDATRARAAAVACWRGGRHAFTRVYCRPRHNAERRKGDAGAAPPVDVYDAALRILEALRVSCHEVVAGGGSWRAVCTRLRRVTGFGGSGFMAKEVLHDATGWASVQALVRDDGAWTPPGPGARRGLNRLHGRALDLGSLAPGDSPAEGRFVSEMRLLLRALRERDAAFCDGVRLDIHDVQFQLCEYDKYCRKSGGERGHVPQYKPCAALFAGRAPPDLMFRAAVEEWDVLRPVRPASPTDEAATSSRDGDLEDLDEDEEDEEDGGGAL